MQQALQKSDHEGLLPGLAASLDALRAASEAHTAELRAFAASASRQDGAEEQLRLRLQELEADLENAQVCHCGSTVLAALPYGALLLKPLWLAASLDALRIASEAHTAEL
jgi:hypothetical protein